jgi:hypothetical protein
MDAPNIETMGRDEENNLTFRITGYRKLSESEVQETIRNFLSQPQISQHKPHIRNETITINTVFGIWSESRSQPYHPRPDFGG